MGTRTRFVSGIALVLGVIATLGIPAVAGDIHVPDSNATQGTCNVIPWGTSTEYRYQAVVPTTMMASGAVYITELGFAACNAGTFSATQCEIRMAHFTGATPSTTFQTNLEKDVTVVFSGPITFPYLANQWSDVGLTSGFQYNGVDSLVVEIRYVNRTGGTSFHRSSNVMRLYTGGTGSYTATTASGSGLAALKMRFTTADVLLTGSGSPTPGGTINLHLSAPSDAGKPYQVGSSLGVGPIPLGSRQIGLDLDDLLVVSTSGFLPAIFVNFAGQLDANGKGTAGIHILNDARLIGVRVHSAFLTLDPAAPLGVSSISNTFTFTVL